MQSKKKILRTLGVIFLFDRDPGGDGDVHPDELGIFRSLLLSSGISPRRKRR